MLARDCEIHSKWFYILDVLLRIGYGCAINADKSCKLHLNKYFCSGVYAKLCHGKQWSRNKISNNKK